jgi:hypothetical protein
MKNSALKATVFLSSILFASLLVSGSAKAQTEQCAVREDQSSICLNDRVIDYRDHTGFVQIIYSNYTAVVQYDDDTTNMMDIQQLAREVQCLHGFCEGDRVRDDEGYLGHITDLFENGQAEVKYDNG